MPRNSMRAKAKKLIKPGTYGRQTHAGFAYDGNIVADSKLLSCES